MRQLLNLDDEQVRAANQPIPKGNIPYLSVNLLTSKTLGNAYLKFAGDNEKEQAHASFISTISLNAYGEEAYQMMLRVVAVLQTSQAGIAFKQNGCGLLYLSPVRDLSAMVGAGIEERAQMDIQISHIHTIETDLKRYDTVQINANS